VNFYKHHLGDYDGATSHLSWDEDMAYSRLMRVYYRRELPIPDAERYRLTRASTRVQRQAIDLVLGEFFTRDGDLWRNKRCDEEIAAYQAQASTNKRIARERIVKRTGDEPSHESFNEPSTNGSPETSAERAPNQNQIPDTKNQYPLIPPSGGNGHAVRLRRKSPGTPVPETFEVTPDLEAWAIDRGLPRERIEPETLKFLNHHKGKGSLQADWVATWRTWVLKALEFGARH
jgi:uncharacterized protein YdaU (DUF1376 family)